jgi:hypothetical protein
MGARHAALLNAQASPATAGLDADAGVGHLFVGNIGSHLRKVKFSLKKMKTSLRMIP